MKWIKIYGPVLLLLGLLVLQTFAQPTGCYAGLHREGEAWLAQDSFKLSIDKFIAARFCLDRPEDDDLDLWIRRAQQAWEDKLNQKIRSLDVALVTSRSLKQQADSLAEKARQYAEEAKAEAIRGQANRLALLAETEMAEGDSSKALYLAFRARQLCEKSNLDGVELTFGRAVFYHEDTLFYQPKQKILDFRFLDGKESLLVSLEDDAVELFDPATGSSRLAASHRGHIRSLEVTSDGRMLFTCGDDRLAMLWDPEVGLIARLEGHTEEVMGGVFSPGGDRILTWSRDNTAILWDYEGQRLTQLTGHRGNIYEGAFSPDDRHLLTRSSDGSVRLWDASGAFVTEIQHRGYYIYTAVFSPDSRQVLTAASDRRAVLWDLAGRQLAEFTHDDIVKEAVFGAGSRIFTRSLDQSVGVWDSSGRLLKRITKEGSEITLVTLNPAGDRLLIAFQDGTVTLWPTDSLDCIPLRGHDGLVRHARWSPDGKYILTTATDQTSRLWDQNGRQLMLLPLGETSPPPSRFSPDGRRIVALYKPAGGLITCPLPDLVYQQMEKEMPFKPEDVKAFNEEFGISNYLVSLFTGNNSDAQ